MTTEQHTIIKYRSEGGECGGGSSDNGNDYEDYNDTTEQTVMARSKEAVPLYHGWRRREEAMPPRLHL